MGGRESTPRSLIVDNPSPNEVQPVNITSAVSQAAALPQDNFRGGGTKYSNEYGRQRRSIGLDEQISMIRDKYEDQIRSLELKNAALFQTKLLQFSDAILRVEKKYLQATAPVVCASEQACVLKCYSESEGETLRCTQQVKAFNDCTRSYHTMLKAAQ